jgi:hypothetical protein
MRITAEMLVQALIDAEAHLLPEHRTMLRVVSDTELRVRGNVDFVNWADALNALCFPPLRAVGPGGEAGKAPDQETGHG